MLAAADEIAGFTGDIVEVLPPSNVNSCVEMDGVFFAEEVAVAWVLTALMTGLVARGSCLQKLVKEGESLKPEYREHFGCCCS